MSFSFLFVVSFSVTSFLLKVVSPLSQDSSLNFLYLSEFFSPTYPLTVIPRVSILFSPHSLYLPWVSSMWAHFLSLCRQLPNLFPALTFLLRSRPRYVHRVAQEHFKGSMSKNEHSIFLPNLYLLYNLREWTRFICLRQKSGSHSWHLFSLTLHL